jgi:hypothetical protein
LPCMCTSRSEISITSSITRPGPIGSAAKWKEEELALDPQSAGCLTRSRTAEK